MIMKASMDPKDFLVSDLQRYIDYGLYICISTSVSISVFYIFVFFLFLFLFLIFGCQEYCYFFNSLNLSNYPSIREHDAHI